MTTAAERSRLADRIWLQSYPEGVPAEIDPERYRSLVEVFRESVQKYRGRAAYVSIGTEMTYGDEPPEVAIEMAIRLAKKFGGDESGRFVNGVLAKLLRGLDRTGKAGDDS